MGDQRDARCEAWRKDESPVHIEPLLVRNVTGKSEGVPSIGLIISHLLLRSRERANHITSGRCRERKHEHFSPVWTGADTKDGITIHE